jgi:phosphoribosylanthranilate isomerase
MKVKICGLRNEQDALFAAKNGADAIGFVFAESKREISPLVARKIISKLPKETKKVGVFVNPSKELIHEIVETTGIDYVQLHGNETPEFCHSIPYPVIKALSIQSKEDLQKIHEYSCDFVLLDGPKGKYHGGNGISFDWSMLSTFDFKHKKAILAGGLNPENVKAAIANTSVFMVDVSSGVETDGEKDLIKIKDFLTAVKSVPTI